MKSTFNKSWIRSRQPRKQVKYRSNAPNHIKRKFLSSTLDKVLRKKYSIRSIEVRKGDEVKIMRGKFSKKQGKVSKVDVKNTRVQIDGAQRTKSKGGGEKLETWFHPSNLKIVLFDETDNRRIKNLKKEMKPKENKSEEKKNNTQEKIKDKKTGESIKKDSSRRK